MPIDRVIRAAQFAGAHEFILQLPLGYDTVLEERGSNLSGGQRHYLCLLSVLAMAPKTILLDEPFAGLDLPTQIRLARRLAALPQQIITISHDPASMAGAARVIWLEGGRVQADGPPAAVLPAFTAAMQDWGAVDADTDLS